jgi:CheY-like chemotaxis protein
LKEGTFHLLLVEDNKYDTMLVEEFLEEIDLPVEVEIARDGEQAIRMVDQTSDLLAMTDLVILDLNLPKRSGHEVLEFIRGNDRTANMCVVILTSSRSPEDAERARNNKANAYWVKPMGSSEMEETVRKLREIIISVRDGKGPLITDENF